ncbi:putative TRAP-type mannitol/chloroaromatic compound transport system small permease component-like protein [Vibrio nigripulchritudo SO65]|uniref:TRAP transporter small permease subunit n=1 Tax=Vibrio nigripulchritudo TaxID=28173 RepID=UPI0003B1BBD4|nr:TRAP transporter small permease [Vibrio nigripulchritudo]CCN33605.1 putative TRAP-type mannitol/chloroaromatic compound transport system small permease component-like protein [Vibrio nigripulchritudo AM115]CCN44733.1 putative TRAP-type mannitol/chloroaromatic compound transport system small permease component-like protein [Vibrio nigripulchritudo FTn2]CCN62997.1 putative TRAP-type mannitol/chloroaromatic compound transport system small permease component-like protein [Vibrio nigripulchritudo 
MNQNGWTNWAGRLSVFIGKTCGVFYFVAIVLAVVEVILRYVFESPTTWNLEVIMALCGSAWLLSAGAITQQQRHITVTVLELVISPQKWRWLQKFALVLSFTAVAGLLWAVWEPAMHSFDYLERSGSAFNPPLPSYLKVLLMFACVLYMLQIAANLFAPKEPSSGE